MKFTIICNVCAQYGKPWPHSDNRFVVTNLLMYSLPDMIPLYLAVPFYTEGVLHEIHIYVYKCSYMIYTELGKLLYESNIHITSYFCEKVIYYNYILLYQKVTLLYYYYLQK